MKRIQPIITILAALFIVACETISIESITPEIEMVEVAFEATTDITRVALDGNTTRWEVGDRISLALAESRSSRSYAEMEIMSSSDISSDGKRATFRGSIPAGNYYGVTALYPAQAINFNETTLERDAADNIFMRSNIPYTGTIVFTATSDSDVVVPITFEHIMHKMEFNLSLADGYISEDLNSNDIAIEVSALSNGSPIEFVQKQKFNLRLNTLEPLSTSITINASGSTTNFSTLIFPLSTITNATLTFNLYIDGEKRYEIVKGPYPSLSMSAGKSTKVNLKLGDDGGNSGGIVEPIVENITLSASKDTIKANGTDSITLSVTTDKGENVTSEAVIYANGSALNSHSFSTMAAGRYTLYAERKGVRSNELTITAEEVTSTGKTIVFAEGVTLTSGWYDVNKKANGDNGDINMCWAATSSNMIQWFQDRYKAAGKTLPAGATDGPGVTSYTNYGPYELELMNVFHAEWDNSRGGHMQEAIPWYFEGKLNGGEFASAGSQAVPLTAGGYWKSIWDSEVYPNIYHGYENVIVPGVEGLDLKNLYITIFNNYYLWGNGTSYLGTERLAEFSKLIVESFKYGLAGLTVNLGANLNAVSHAVTLWGYEIDNSTGLITRLWITDSDDLMTEPKTPLLNEYSVSIDEGKSHIKLTGNTRYGACYVVSIHPFAGYGIGI